MSPLHPDDTSLAEEPLREGGNEADLDEEAKDRLDGRQNRHWITRTLHRLEEAAPMEARHAQHQRLVPGKLVELGRRQTKGQDPRTSQQVETGEDADH